MDWWSASRLRQEPFVSNGFPTLPSSWIERNFGSLSQGCFVNRQLGLGRPLAAEYDLSWKLSPLLDRLENAS